MSAVLVEDASFSRGGTPVLSNVDFVVAGGAVLCLTGANGSGKTTVLRAIAGVVRPTAGRILVGGELVDERSPAFRRRLAAVVGSVPFSLTMTAREHLTAVSASWGARRRDAESVADAVLRRLGLEELTGRFPHELSSGQFQMLSLASVLARPFDVLVLDEPEQRLDADRRELLARVLGEERDRGAAVVIATHSRALRDALQASEFRLGAQGGEEQGGEEQGGEGRDGEREDSEGSQHAA
ncbi:ABC transporter ATP-binding protein [Pseudoclavibacter sp. AY1F1]|uniref:ABC transporter ATP-binding protein n=1 Tax=Pseudoclavibacter sp. AY1F1 TaxID=2080583 RepID=UPI000CE733B5|nr:ABC transporter ATP-binding protein [Pseudoclavibacter sp. AY1F1]PPF42208.1 ABC transporter ATP-binding protein [Pseudoclavibacter sp. AY1F1]